MFPTFYEEESVELDGGVLRLAINFRAITAIEGLTGEGMDVTVASVLSGGAHLNVVGKVLWGLLREHHPETGLDEAAGLMFNKASAVKVGLAISAVLMRAFSIEQS